MNIIFRSTCALLLLGTTLPNAADAETHGWPLEPADEDHPLGSTLGELVVVKEAGTLATTTVVNESQYQHPGIDILAVPYPSSSAPWVIAAVGGTVNWMDMNQYSKLNFVRIVTADGAHRYKYGHLAFNSLTTPFTLASNNGGSTLTPFPVAAGARIAQVTTWGCGYDHLHYEIERVNGDRTISLENPLLDIEPRPDPFAPEIFDINLADHGTRWSVIDPASEACTVVNGEVDVVAHVRDRDDAGSNVLGASNVGVYNLRWRACPDNTPDCNWNDTHEFDDMPSAWSFANNGFTKDQFSVTTPWQSTASEWQSGVVGGQGSTNNCSTDVSQTFMVPTSLSPTGRWKTNGSPDGGYSVGVEASDLAGNVTMRNIRVCVQNETSCTTDLAVRDGAEDSGAVPYIRSPDEFSPDITVNPGTTNEDSRIKRGVTNIIVVTVWNRGSCTLPADTTYNVCLRWSKPPDPLLNPIPPSRDVGCRTETVPAGGWEPGTNRKTTVLWTPPPGVPLGRIRLLASSELPADPPQEASSALVDNNRADRHVTVVVGPGP